MSAIDQLLRLADEYMRAAELTETTVSTHLFNDGKKLGAIRGGADLSTRRFEEALRTLSRRWPPSAIWPDDIDRPFVPPIEAAA